MALLNVVTYKYSFRALALLFFAGSSLFTFIKYMYAILGKVGVGGGQYVKPIIFESYYVLVSTLFFVNNI